MLNSGFGQEDVNLNYHSIRNGASFNRWVSED
jgi:hypothetical protein